MFACHSPLGIGNLTAHGLELIPSLAHAGPGFQFAEVGPVRSVAACSAIDTHGRGQIRRGIDRFGQQRRSPARVPRLPLYLPTSNFRNQLEKFADLGNPVSLAFHLFPNGKMWGLQQVRTKRLKLWFRGTGVPTCTELD